MAPAHYGANRDGQGEGENRDHARQTRLTDEPNQDEEYYGQ